MQKKPLNQKSKQKYNFICSNCHSQYPIQYGRCPSCRQWDTMSIKASKNADKKPEPKVKNSNFGFTRQLDMFEYIWNTTVHKSQISGRDLSMYKKGKDISPFWYSCFQHILPKGRFAKFKLYSNNICLVHPDEQTLLDQGTEEQRIAYEKQWNCSFNVYYELKKKLMYEYQRL